LWQTIIKAKYLRNKSVASVKQRAHDSPGWKNLMKVKDFYFAGRKVLLRKGNLVRFWKDPWLDDIPLCESFLALFDICQGQDWTFERTMSCNLVIPFRRRMLPDMISQWEHIKNRGMSYPSSLDSDTVTWSLSVNGCFSNKSMYQHLEKNLAGSHNKWIWKAKVPLKIKIFLWQLFQNAILTRDNLKKRKWGGSPLCSFCQQEETMTHLFFECSNAKVIWGNLGGILGTSLCPSSLWQSVAWFYRFYPRGRRFHMLLLSAICWGFGI
jgi:hypothetical protein